MQMENHSRITRRGYLKMLTLASLAAPLLPVPSEAAPPTTRTVVNGVLSAYGLPTLRDTPGFSPLVEQYGSGEVVEFLYPSAWVVARSVGRGTAAELNPTVLSKGQKGSPQQGRSSGLTAGDYRRSEGLAFFVSIDKGARDVAGWNGMDIASLVTPGDATGQDPEVRITRDEVMPDGSRYIFTKYESTTASGYTVERKAITRAIVRSDGTLYALCGSCTANRWKKIKDSFDVALESFQVYKI